MTKEDEIFFEDKQQIIKSAAAAINDVADWLTQQFSGNADEPKTEPKKEPELKLEDVRAVLADMSL